MIFFTYGTLKRGHCRNNVLTKNNAYYLGVAVTEPNYVLLDLGNFPAAKICDTDKMSIYGEIWEVDFKIFEILDKIEGTAYKRDVIYLKEINLVNLPLYDIESIQNKQAVAYLWQKESNNYPIINNGFWRNDEIQCSAMFSCLR